MKKDNSGTDCYSCFICLKANGSTQTWVFSSLNGSMAFFLLQLQIKNELLPSSVIETGSILFVLCLARALCKQIICIISDFEKDISNDFGGNEIQITVRLLKHFAALRNLFL